MASDLLRDDGGTAVPSAWPTVEVNAPDPYAPVQPAVEWLYAKPARWRLDGPSLLIGLVAGFLAAVGIGGIVIAAMTAALGVG